MNAISNILSIKKKKKTCALIPFLTAGYPNIEITIKALKILSNQGADIIELGIPYADALADGPIIQESSKVALQNNVYIDEVFYILSQVNKYLKAPIIIFTYYNPILVRGLSDFIISIAKYGVKGLVIPDLPLEEVDYILSLCKSSNIELILFIAPTSSSNRISSILSKSPGCIYLVSSTGVTGTRKVINSSINNLSHYIKSNTDKQIMLGFGISSVDQVSEISKWNIDGIVIGSAFIKTIKTDPSLKLLSNFCEDIRQAM
uniref:Tryptophan synthase alpha chain n=1 Tax=Pleonosporium borreri TaxID=2575635 RepID=A0A4D6WYN6_9FLOR|nr:Tryptophan synthase alpha subunit [Pleonosporium borreri]